MPTLTTSLPQHHFHYLFPSSKLTTSTSLFLTPNARHLPSLQPFRWPQILCAKRPQRTGKLRYPSEKKKLFQREAAAKRKKMDAKVKFSGFWRLSNLGVDFHKDPGKDFVGVSDGLLEQIAKVLEFPVATMLPAEAFLVVRKSFDARKVLKEPKFVYSVDMDVEKLVELEPRLSDFISELDPKPGYVEHMPQKEPFSGDLISIIHGPKTDKDSVVVSEEHNGIGARPNNNNGFATVLPAVKPKVAVVGSGPSGLFAALVLAELGAEVTLIERGQPVEQRGRDIGALVVRRIIQLDSNFCFGEVRGVMGSL